MSPRSTHGIKNIHEKTKEEIKTEAQDQQDHEFQKRNSYIMEYNIPIITFYGDDFKSTKDIFEVIKKFLEPTREYKDQLLFEHVEERFLVNDIEITAS